MQKHNKIRALILGYLQILIGGAIYSAGFQFFMYPNAIATGGVTGIAMILNFLIGTPIGVMVLVMNVPLFLFSWKKFGTHFMVGSLVGTAACSILVDLFALVPFEATHEPLLGAIFGGIARGLGLGLIYRTGASTGGTDIVAKFLRRRHPYINFSTFLLVVDAVIVAAFAIIFNRYDSAMYAVICMFVASKMIDLVLYGAVNSKVCYIITDESRAMKDAILATLQRGVTFLHGEGAWSGQQKDIILCVIKQAQIVDLKRVVQRIDEKAFVIVSDSREVFGQGFSGIDDDD